MPKKTNKKDEGKGKDDCVPGKGRGACILLPPARPARNWWS